MSTRVAATLLIIAIDVGAVMRMVDRALIAHANHPVVFSNLDRTKRAMNDFLAKLPLR